MQDDETQSPGSFAVDHQTEFGCCSADSFSDLLPFNILSIGRHSAVKFGNVLTTSAWGSDSIHSDLHIEKRWLFHGSFGWLCLQPGLAMGTSMTLHA